VAGLFAGESMFHTVRDASKVALVALVDLLRDEHAGTRVLDVQWRTDHLATLGVVEVPRTTYLSRLEDALALPLPAAFDR
jgi:leucyl/phenylalanyl-tRNA--protein transferase